MVSVKDIKDSLFHLVFPHLCSGCGSDLITREKMLCMRCEAEMPETGFHLHPDNPVEKIFWGRIEFLSATAQYYFTRDSLIQRLMHQFKYKGNKELGRHLGRLMGCALRQTDRFGTIDGLVPLPLFPAREKKRGYNQASVLCEGIAEIINVDMLHGVVARIIQTDTQTKKGRIERWQNMEGKFKILDAGRLANKHVLLVDDVVTTGATLEACALQLLQGSNTKLSIATLCFASR